MRGRGDNREKARQPLWGNITGQSLPRVRTAAEFYCCCFSCLASISAVSSLFFFFSSPASKTESQSRELCANHRKAPLFDKLLVQNGLFLLILWKLRGARQEKQTEGHYNSTAATYVVSQGDALAGYYSVRSIPVTPNWQSCKVPPEHVALFDVAEKGWIRPLSFSSFWTVRTAATCDLAGTSQRKKKSRTGIEFRSIPAGHIWIQCSLNCLHNTPLSRVLVNSVLSWLCAYVCCVSLHNWFHACQTFPSVVHSATFVGRKRAVISFACIGNSHSTHSTLVTKATIGGEMNPERASEQAYVTTTSLIIANYLPNGAWNFLCVF